MLTFISLVLATAAPPPAPIQGSTVEAGRPSIDGDWDGGMTVPAGLTIPFQLHVDHGAGQFAAPDQNVHGLAILVTQAMDHVVIQIPAAKATFDGTLSAHGDSLSGTWSKGPARFPAHFSKRAAGAAAIERVRPQTPRAPFPYQTEDVTLPGGSPDVQLAATLTRPRGPGPFPAVVLIGGNGPQNRDETYAGHRPFLLLADRLSREGIAVLRYDKRGVGSSSGSYARATGVDFTRDAVAAFVWLSRRSDIAADRIGILGLSEGGLIASEVAAQERRAAFLVLMSAPGVRGNRLMIEQERQDAIQAGKNPGAVRREVAMRQNLLTVLEHAGNRNAVNEMTAIATAAGHSPEEAAAIVREMTSPEYRVFLTDDPASVLRKLRSPVLVIAGARDQQVPPALNLPPIKTALAHSRRAQIVELDGLNHLLQPAQTGAPSEYATIDTTIDPTALDLIAGWIRRAASENPRTGL